VNVTAELSEVKLAGIAGVVDSVQVEVTVVAMLALPAIEEMMLSSADVVGKKGVTEGTVTS
jgi:hypothetical protein